MDFSNPEVRIGLRKRRARPSYSCVECTRRKLRCSKHIPCSACVERGIAQSCRRRTETVSSTSGGRVISSRTRRPAGQDNGGRDTETIRSTQNEVLPEGLTQHSTSTTTAPRDASRNSFLRPLNKIVDAVTEDAAVTLEFLALSRQRILQVAQVEQQSQSNGARGNIGADESESLFKPRQVRSMMRYHQEYIAWIHHVVHLPTFREECESFLADPTQYSGLWLGLYYAMLSVTLYHMDPLLLEEMEIYSSCDLAELCYHKSIDSLNEADYMNNHSLFSLQAICLLIYIGHNIGQSDRISVLLACAVRISQCLCLHRLGPDSTTNARTDEDRPTMQRQLIEREVSKRVWFFLVRQDWLQIPFNNTYTIHLTQFNTPMPSNCDEEIEHMFNADGVIDHEQEHYTQGSYTAVLNHVAVLIWKTQDKLCQLGPPNGVDGGLHKLYAEVIRADQELRELMETMPTFFRDSHSSPVHQNQHPAHIRHQHRVLSLAMAHKFYSIHRHFQIPSFKDPWFAYTKVSCFPIMRRSLAAVLSLPPNDPYTSIARNMWTTNTQLVTTTIWLLFESLFSRDASTTPTLLSEEQQMNEIQDLARQALTFLRANQARSRIAKRGVALIDTLLRMDRTVAMGDYSQQFNLKDVITRVEGSDRLQCTTSELGMSRDTSWAPFELTRDGPGSIVDWLSRDAATWEDLIGALDGGTCLSAAWDG
ncbi:hypothetical protein BDV19DRAFT_401014 [Aspergillus venezuelensis]